MGLSIVVDYANILEYDLRDTISESIKETHHLHGIERDDNSTVILACSRDNKRAWDTLMELIPIVNGRHYLIAPCMKDSDTTVASYANAEAKKGNKVLIVTGDVRLGRVVLDSQHRDKFTIIIPSDRVRYDSQLPYDKVRFVEILTVDEGSIRKRLNCDRTIAITSRRYIPPDNLVLAIKGLLPVRLSDIHSKLTSMGYMPGQTELIQLIFKMARDKEIYIWANDGIVELRQYISQSVLP